MIISSKYKIYSNRFLQLCLPMLIAIKMMNKISMSKKIKIKMMMIFLYFQKKAIY